MAQRKLQNLSDEQLYADWVSWIKRIFDEIAHLAWNRRVFRSVGRVFEKNPHLQERGGFLWEWMRGNYIAGAGMALRREVDRQYTANMRHLLFEIEKRPTVLSRERYYAGWPERDKFDAMFRERSFNQFALVHPDNEPLHDHIDPLSVRSDRELLVLQTEVVQDYIEQTIAHRGGAESIVPVTFKDFNAAIDAVVPIFKKYYALLTLSSVAQVEPVPQYNTHEVFTFPWDRTCCDMWLEFMKDKRLNWTAIQSVYRNDEDRNAARRRGGADE